MRSALKTPCHPICHMASAKASSQILHLTGNYKSRDFQTLWWVLMWVTNSLSLVNRPLLRLDSTWRHKKGRLRSTGISLSGVERTMTSRCLRFSSCIYCARWNRRLKQICESRHVWKWVAWTTTPTRSYNTARMMHLLFPQSCHWHVYCQFNWLNSNMIFLWCNHLSNVVTSKWIALVR